MKNHMFKRLLALAVAMVMVLGMLPELHLHAHAEGEEEVTAPQSEDWCGNPLCSQEDNVHVTSCAQYVAPENPKCYCVEKCAEPNIWCDVCGFDYTQCGGTDRAVGYGTGWELDGTTLIVTGHLTALPEGVEYSKIEVHEGGNLDLGEATVTCDVDNDFGTISSGTFNTTNIVSNYSIISGGTFHDDVNNEYGATISGGTFTKEVRNDGTISGGDFISSIINKGTITGGTIWYGTVTNKESGTISNAKFESNAKLAEGSTPPQSVIHSVNGEDVALTYNAPLPAALGDANAWYQGDTQVTSGTVPLNYTTYVGEYTITTEATTNGTVSVPATAKYGQTVAVTADASEGYVLDTVTVQHGEAEVTVTDNTFTMPAGAVTVTATFSADMSGIQPGYYLVGILNGENKWEVDSSASTRLLREDPGTAGQYYLNYSLSNDDKVKIAYFDGTTITQLFQADGKEAYTIGTAKAGTVKILFRPEGNDSWSYTYFAVTPAYNVTVNTVENGTVSTDKAVATNGETVTLTVTPAEGYELVKLEVVAGSGSVDLDEENYTFTMPNQNVTVTAYFQSLEKRTVYFDNSAAQWSQVNIYFWSDSNSQMISWPGVGMIKAEGNIYSCQIPADAEHVIFNDGSSKTNDQILGDKNCCKGNVSGSTWYTYPCEHTYENGTCTGCDAYEPATDYNADGVYEIYNAGQLFWFAQQVNEEGNKEIKGTLRANIDLENRPWTPIGAMGEENSFRGVFDGLNYTIRGLYVEGSESGVGFFGEVRTGTVRNFTIHGEVVVNTEVDYVGGVIGSICGVNGETDLERNGAIIQNITSFVNVTAKAHGIGMIGGFVGHADHQSLIEQCSWYGTFDAGEYRVDSGAGGFIGKIQENTSEVTIRNCGAYGTIKTNYAGDYNNTATIYMGGFLSFSNTNAKTTLENCLFAGRFERGENLTDEARLGAFGTLRSVNAIKNCYYLGDDGLAAVHSDSNLKPGSDNVAITSVTGEELRSKTIATKLGECWTQGEHYPVPHNDVCEHSHSYTYADNGDGTHDKVCDICRYVEVDNEAHTGGTATCTTQAVCEACGASYGELNANNHNWENGVCTYGCNTQHDPHTWESGTCTVCGYQCDHDGAEYKDNGDGTHDQVCTCGKVGVDNEAHSGGTATCTKQAECQHCGASYGELAAHTPDANGKCTAENCGYQYPAKVGDTFYESIHKALRAAEGISGCTLTLLDNITLTSSSRTASYVNKGTITLDLNGKTFSSNKGTLSVLGTVDLTIRDSIGGGKIVSTYSNAIYQTGGKLTIESGTFEGTLAGVFLSYDSTLIVKGGTFTGSRAMITGFGSNVKIDLTAIDPAGFTLKNNGSGTFAPKLPEGYGMVGSDGKLLSSLSAEQSATVHKHEYQYTDLGDGKHQQACSCGLTTGEPAAHSTTAEDDKAANCGSKAYCSVCDSEYGEVDKTKHDSSVECVNGFCPNGCYEPAVLVDGVYQISNAGNLYWFADKVVSENAVYGSADAILTCDIRVNEGTMTASSTDARVWTPIGKVGFIDNKKVEYPYTGTFEGNGKTVSGLYFNDTSANFSVGLFSLVGEGGTVRNVGVADSYLCGSDSVGAVAGNNYGTVTGCYNTGTVISSGAAGGVVGGNSGTVTNCYNTGTVSGESNVGGVVGNNSNSGTITDCHNTGAVSGTTTVGGVAGIGGIMSNCYNTGTVSGESNVGGVAGSGGSSTQGCYNTGTVSGESNVGGVVGHLIGESILVGCYSSGTVNGTTNVGGVAGYLMGKAILEGCYNTGTVSGEDEVGGVVGWNWNGTCTNCYFDSTVYTGNAIGNDSGTATNVEGKTTEQFASGEVAYLLSQGENGSIWGQDLDNGKPAQTAPTFTGAKVYYGYRSCGDTEKVYTNNANVFAEKPEHTQNPTYTDNHDGTHSAVYPCCGTTVSPKPHAMDTATGKCVCGFEMAEASVTMGFAGGIAGDGITTYYETLSEAISNVSTATADDNATVTLLKDNDAGQNVYGGVFTLDLNGKDLKSRIDGLYISGSGTNVTIADSKVGGEVSGESDGVRATENSTVTISGGSVSGNEFGVNADNCTVTISGGTVSGDGQGVYAENSTVTISGGTVSGNGHGVYVTENSTVTISSGTVSGSTFYGASVNDNSTVTISGGTVSGGNGGVIVSENSTVEIRGGEVGGYYAVNAIRNSTVKISGGIISNNVHGVSAAENSTVTISGGNISSDIYGVEADNSTVTISGGNISSDVYGVYAENSTVTISGGSITGSDCDLFGTVKLLLPASGTGTTFPGGITVTEADLVSILGEGAAYWQGGRMIVPEDGQQEITGGDVTVKKACDHQGNTNKTCTDNGDGTHSLTCSVCYAAFTEEHNFENDAHKCACGVVETFTVYWASAESLGLETGTSTFGQDFVQTITVPENTHLRIDDVYLRSDSSIHVNYTYENGVLTIAAEDLPAGDIEVLCDHYVEVTFCANGGVIKPHDGYPEPGDTGFAEDGSYWIQKFAVGLEINNFVNAEMSRTGYTFVEWRDASGKLYPMNVPGRVEPYILATEDVTLYAQWQCNHTIGGVEFRDNGDGTHNGYCGECGEPLGNYVERPHAYDETTHQCVCGVIEIFAYQVETYTMDGYGNYGEPVTEEKSAPYGTQVNATPNSGAEGFYLDTEHENSLLTATVPANNDLVLKVYIGRNQYPITWDLNGGGTYDNNLPESMYYGVSQLTIFDKFVKEGYTFSHLEDASGNRYVDGSPNSDCRRFRDVDMPVGGLTLKAIWSVNAYALHVQDQTLEVDYGTALDAAISGITPEKTGHTFTGWTYYYLDDEGVERPYTGTTMPAMELYAQSVFTPIEYNITWDMAGCSYSVSNYNGLPSKLPYNVDGDDHSVNFAELTAPEGYEFVRFEDGDGNALSYVVTDKYRLNLTVSGDMTVKAVIQPKAYMATWETGDGGSYEKEFKYGETITIPENEFFPDTFRKAGYTLTGWEGYTEGMTMPIDGVTFTAKWQINSASLAVTSAPYTGQPHAPTVTVEGLTEGEDFTVSYPEDMTNVGEKVITVTGVLGGETTVTYAIEKAPAPAITFPTVLNAITYGQQLQEAKLSFYENELGRFDWTAPIDVPGSAGVHDYALDFYPNQEAMSNYIWKDTSDAQWIESRSALCITAKVTVNRAASIMETAPTEKTLTYNGQPQELVTAGSVVGGTLQYSVNGGEWSEAVPTASEAGYYQISYQVVGNSNYIGIGTSALPMVQIQQATLTVTAQDHTITYGDTPSNNGITYDGFVNGETAAVLGGTVAYTYNYAQYGNVGIYRITPAGLTSDNYRIIFADGTLTVYPKAIPVKADALSKIYGQADPELTYQADGLVNGDKLTGELKREAGENIGSYAIGQNTLTAGNNYTVIYTGAELTIEAKAIAEADVKLNGSLTYTSQEQAQPITVTEGITYEVTGNKATNAGTYALNVKGTGNYTGTVTKTWTIAKAAQAIQAAQNVNLTCKQTHPLAPEAESEITFVSSDPSVVTVDESGKLTALKPGTATITLTAAENANYLQARKTIAVTVSHDYTGVVTAPTCEDKGYTTYTCVCGHSYVADYVDATGHDYRGVITTQPDCENEGVKTFTCANDESHTYTEKVAATGHSPKAAVEENRVEATCTEKGSYEMATYCGVCGKELGRTQHTIDAIGHDYDDGVITTQPDCENEGVKTFTCANDESHTYTEKVAATGHNPKAAVEENRVEATCTEKGSYELATYCGTCGKELGRTQHEIPAKGHSFGSWTVVKAATCTEKGLERRDCSNCDHYETRATAFTGHSYRDAMDPSCEVCGEHRAVYVESIPMLRLYNPVTGEHHYTGSAEERDTLVSLGWNYEGVAWNAPVEFGDPVCRYFNPNTGDHHYTMCGIEGDNLVDEGWIYEGVAWNSASSEHLPIYRLYNPNAEIGAHHYTGSAEERDNLVAEGWSYEGIGWYALLY